MTMADHVPYSRRGEQRQQRVAKRHLSDLQQRILQWLRTELRRRRQAGDIEGVPFPALVQAMTADKAGVIISLRQLMRKGLVTVTLPRGAWTRYVLLTEKGQSQAHVLTTNARMHELPEKSRRAEKRERDRKKQQRRFRH